ncbi:MAG: cytochrome c [Leptospiraceae bacterium]|nr:cytochrome c [Leptospiraceae bacterium]
MLSKVVVVKPAEFDQWYADAGKALAQNTNDNPGEKLYQSAGCFACHSTDGSKKVGPSFKGLFGKMETVTTGGAERQLKVDEVYLKTSITNPTADIVKGFPPAMPPQNLKPAEIDQLVEYIKSLK